MDQQDLAVRADRARHIEIERLLLGPASIRARRVGAAVLVTDDQAAIGDGAGRQAKLAAIDLQIGLGVRIAKGVDDRDNLAGAVVR